MPSRSRAAGGCRYSRGEPAPPLAASLRGRGTSAAPPRPPRPPSSCGCREPRSGRSGAVTRSPAEEPPLPSSAPRSPQLQPRGSARSACPGLRATTAGGGAPALPRSPLPPERSSAPRLHHRRGRLGGGGGRRERGGDRPGARTRPPRARAPWAEPARLVPPRRYPGCAGRARVYRLRVGGGGTRGVPAAARPGTAELAGACPVGTRLAPAGLLVLAAYSQTRAPLGCAPHTSAVTGVGCAAPGLPVWPCRLSTRGCKQGSRLRVALRGL